jgi:ABC-type multidrug transport system fused ATPase/permease subunit
MVLLVLMMLISGNGNISEVIPVLGVFAFAGLKIFPAMQQTYQALTLMRTVHPMLQNLHRDIRATRQTQPTAAISSQLSTDARIRLPFSRSLRLKGICYAYPATDRPALCSFDAEIAARSTVGIVGGSGVGKTTAVDVILGLLEPQSGSILVDDVAVTPGNLRSWQNAIGYVPQSIYLIDGTVAENIALGLPSADIDMAAVERAASIARLHDFVISELPSGYATAVGERGIRLSGGQRQRIGIARALYHDPEVLILDEATSALDNLTERAFMEAVQSLGGKKTIIMIAHRLSTVRDCEQIVLMEQGRVLAIGTYDQLVAENETFRRMATA